MIEYGKIKKWNRLGTLPPGRKVELWWSFRPVVGAENDGVGCG